MIFFVCFGRLSKLDDTVFDNGSFARRILYPNELIVTKVCKGDPKGSSR